MISRGYFSNGELLGYVLCYDAPRGHSSSTLQEDITIATSTRLGEKLGSVRMRSTTSSLGLQT